MDGCIRQKNFFPSQADPFAPCGWVDQKILIHDDIRSCNRHIEQNGIQSRLTRRDSIPYGPAIRIWNTHLPQSHHIRKKLRPYHGHVHALLRSACPPPPRRHQCSFCVDQGPPGCRLFRNTRARHWQFREAQVLVEACVCRAGARGRLLPYRGWRFFGLL